MIWRAILRWSLALAVTVGVLITVDTHIAEHLLEVGQYGIEYVDSPRSMGLVTANYFMAFLLGGIIARSRFVLAALALSVLLLVANAASWASFHAVTFGAMLSELWLVSLVCVAGAMVGAWTGVWLGRRLLPPIGARTVAT